MVIVIALLDGGDAGHSCIVTAFILSITHGVFLPLLFAIAPRLYGGVTGDSTTMELSNAVS